MGNSPTLISPDSGCDSHAKRGMVKFLTYNLFMRPPGSMYRHYTFITMTVSKPSGDYKSKRLKILGDSLSVCWGCCSLTHTQRVLTLFAFKSCSPHGQTAPPNLLRRLKKMALSELLALQCSYSCRYFVHAPSPPVTSMRVVDAGLTVLSKHPIASTDFVLYKSGNSFMISYLD